MLRFCYQLGCKLVKSLQHPTAIFLDGLIPIFQLANPIFRLAMPMIISDLICKPHLLVGQPTFLLARCIHHKITPIIHDFTESPMASASILARFMAASASLGSASRSSKCSELRTFLVKIVRQGVGPTWSTCTPPKVPTNGWFLQGFNMKHWSKLYKTIGYLHFAAGENLHEKCVGTHTSDHIHY